MEEVNEICLPRRSRLLNMSRNASDFAYIRSGIDDVAFAAGRPRRECARQTFVERRAGPPTWVHDQHRLSLKREGSPGALE